MDLFVTLAYILPMTLLCYAFIRRRALVGEGKKLLLPQLRPASKKECLAFVLVPLTLLGVGLMLVEFYDLGWLFATKRLTLTAVLWAAAVSDWRELRIPNKLLLCALLGRVLFLAPEVLTQGTDALATLLSEGIAFVAVVVLCLACMLAVRGGLGMGDFKLMLVMALYQGVEGICYAMCGALFAAFLVAVVLLLTKKKKRTDVMPFAPFMLVGVLAGSILSGV